MGSQDGRIYVDIKGKTGAGSSIVLKTPSCQKRNSKTQENAN